MESSRWRWLDAALVLSLATALLFAAGHSYRAGYLATIGLDAEQFLKSFESTLMMGFYAGMLGIADKLGVIVWALEGVAIVVASIAIVGFARRFRTWARLLVFRNRKSRRWRRVPMRWQEKFIRAASTVITTTGTFCLIFLSLLIVLVVAERSGKNQAIRLIDGFDGKYQRVVHFRGGGMAKLGPVVICDEARCAYLARDGYVVLQRDSVVSESGGFPKK